MNDSIETSFLGNEFCQWLINNQHVENEYLAHIYLKELLAKKQIICINQNQTEDDTDILKHWYAFSK
jgi:hypothetical protein